MLCFILYFITMLSKLILSFHGILSRVLCGVGVRARKRGMAIAESLAYASQDAGLCGKLVL